MESKHISRNINVSLRKIRMILPEVKKLTPTLAVTKLAFVPSSAAKVVRSAVQTAIANASATLKVTPDMLEFRKVYADQGLTLKRYRAGSRGSPLPVVRRMSHITVILGEKQAQPRAVAPKQAKADAVPETKKASTKSKVKAAVKAPKTEEKAA